MKPNMDEKKKIEDNPLLSLIKLLVEGDQPGDSDNDGDTDDFGNMW